MCKMKYSPYNVYIQSFLYHYITSSLWVRVMYSHIYFSAAFLILTLYHGCAHVNETTTKSESRVRVITGKYSVLIVATDFIHLFSCCQIHKIELPYDRPCVLALHCKTSLDEMAYQCLDTKFIVRLNS